MVLIVVLWGVLGLMIYLVDPELVRDVLIPGLYLPFFLLFLAAAFFTLAVIFANSRRGFLVALGLTVFLILRVYQLGNLLNLLLIIGIVVAINRYFSV
jgi:hypothetical protein